MKKTAIVDIGSNTVKMSLFRADGTRLSDDSRPVGLVGHLAEGNLTDEGIEKLIDTLKEFRNIAEKKKATLYPFATASLRLAKNSAEVIARVKEATGLTIDLVSGEEEANLSLAGVSFASGKALPSQAVLFDMGGGSCEIIAAKDHRIVLEKSLILGSLALHKKFVKNILPTGEELAAIARFAKDSLAEAGIELSCKEVFAVGGTIRAFAAFHAHRFGKKKGDLPYDMTVSELRSLLDEIAAMSLTTKLSLLSLCPQRIHTMPAGLAAIVALMDAMGCETLTLVQGGVREGYFCKITEKENKTRETKA